MTDDLPAQLRAMHDDLRQGAYYTAEEDLEWDVMVEAADEIERLRSALELIADGLPSMDGRSNIDPKRFAAGVLERWSDHDR